jgi:hypothetical protein
MGGGKVKLNERTALFAGGLPMISRKEKRKSGAKEARAEGREGRSEWKGRSGGDSVNINTFRLADYISRRAGMNSD